MTNESQNTFLANVIKKRFRVGLSEYDEETRLVN